MQKGSQVAMDTVFPVTTEVKNSISTTINRVTLWNMFFFLGQGRGHNIQRPMERTYTYKKRLLPFELDVKNKWKAKGIRPYIYFNNHLIRPLAVRASTRSLNALNSLIWQPKHAVYNFIPITPTHLSIDVFSSVLLFFSFLAELHWRVERGWRAVEPVLSCSTSRM